MNLDILVVDDEKAIRHLIVDVLESMGHAVSDAEDGAAAVSKLKEKAYDVLITDIRMPHISGIELLSIAKNINRKTYGVIITSYATKDNAIEALRLGAFEYLEKPFPNLDVIVNVIKRILKDIKIKSS